MFEQHFLLDKCSRINVRVMSNDVSARPALLNNKFCKKMMEPQCFWDPLISMDFFYALLIVCFCDKSKIVLPVHALPFPVKPALQTHKSIGILSAS